jgi:hypothetical protein
MIVVASASSLIPTAKKFLTYLRRDLFGMEVALETSHTF